MGEPGGAVVVAVDVRAGVEETLGVFTAGIGDWWPVAAYSVEPGRVDAVMLEGRAGGRLYERWVGGGEADWGAGAGLGASGAGAAGQAHPDPEDGARMVDAAHASQHHWREVGGPPETRGEWLVSHVHAVLGRPEPALHHARRCQELADGEPGVADFDHAYAAEAMARALACAGDRPPPGTRGPPPPAPPSPTTRTARSSPTTSPPAPGSA
jgi:hypothetical protein